MIYLSIFLFFAFSASSCSEKQEEKEKTLSYSIAEEIPVPEPSGLDISFDEQGFWTVSDENSKVYLLDSWGNRVKSFKVKGADLEGITVIDDSTIAVVLERTNEIVVLDTEGNELRRAAINLKGEFNSGLEGITYDHHRKRFYLLNEKKPQLLIVLDENFAELKRDTLSFAKDVSGIFYDDTDSTLWILSDESKQIFKTDLSGNPMEVYKINISQPEGIAFNKSRTKLFIVSDKTEKIYVFNLE